jgi:hypothetical protein
VRPIVTAAAAGKQLAHNLDKVSWIHRRFFNEDGSYRHPVDKWYSEHFGGVRILGTWLDPRISSARSNPGGVPLKPDELSARAWGHRS